MAVLVVAGAVLRLEVARQDLFADELSTYWIVTSGGLRHVVDTVASTAEITPPLSFVLAWLSIHLGDSPALIRLPAVVGGIAAIPLTYAVGRRTIGQAGALVAATLVTLSPFMIYYSAEGRGYGLLMGLLLLSTLALLRAVEGAGAWWWVLYAVSICLAAYTHYTGAFVLAGQLGWLLVVHPPVRRPALLSTAVAALAYLPWVPSLRGDLSSPTTLVLSVLSPMDGRSVVDALSQWSFGFPAANIGLPLPYDISGSSLTELPGVASLFLLAAFLAAAVAGLVARARRPSPTPAPSGPLVRGGVVLVVLLAVASPLGAALQSAVGSNVFRTRSMAPSWPYLALALAALATAGPALWRRLATGMLVLSFVASMLTMRGAEFHRPDFGQVVAVAEERSVGVVVQAATWTPGPLTNFEVEGTGAPAPVLRLTVPEQMEHPFWFGQAQPDPADIARRAVAIAGRRPILVVAFVPPQPVVDAFVAELPVGYELSHTYEVRGIFRMEARLYERAPDR